MKRLFLVLVLLTAAVSLSSAQAIRSTTIQEMPFEIEDVNPCSGEPIKYSGVIQEVFHEVSTPNGTLSSYTLTLKGVSAIGLETATAYRSTGTSHTSGTATDAHGSLTMVSNAHFIAAGGGLVFSASFQFHTTVNANGELVAVVDQGNAVCR